MTDMKYTSRTVRSNDPGLTQEQALASLYSHYGSDIRVTSVKRRGDAWVVRFDQKTAEFPPPKDDEEAPEPKEKSEAPDGPSDGPPFDEPADDAPDGLDGPPGEGDSEDGDKKGGDGEILHLLHEIATALGISGGPEDKLGPEGDLPGPPPPGPDAGLDGPPDLGAGPGGPPMAKKPTKLKPGEVLPSQTPMGAPAFASTREAMTMTVESEPVDPRQYKASQAQSELEAACPGYKVEQLTFDRTANVYRALLSAH